MSGLTIKSYEPKYANRWFIELHGLEIPSWLICSYMMHNEGEDFVVSITMKETTAYTLNPGDLFYVTGLTINYLDGLGNIANALIFEILGTKFVSGGDVGEHEILEHDLVFKVNPDTIKKKYTDNLQFIIYINKYLKKQLLEWKTFSIFVLYL